MKLVRRPGGGDRRPDAVQDPSELPPEVVGWIIIKAVVRAAAEVMTELDGLAEPRR